MSPDDRCGGGDRDHRRRSNSGRWRRAPPRRSARSRREAGTRTPSTATSAKSEDQAVDLEPMGHCHESRATAVPVVRRLAPVCDSVARADEGGRSEGDRAGRAACRARSRRRSRGSRASRSPSSAAPARRPGFPTRRTPRRARSSSTTPGRSRRGRRRSRSRPQDEVERLRAGQLLIAFLQPLTDRDGDRAALRQKGVLGFAMESIPRTTRAQSMDALSSQATVSGYKAVLIARRPAAALLPDADDGRRHDRAGARARARRRRRRPAGDRDRAPPRRGRVGLRRAPGRPRAGAVARRDRSSTSASSARRPRAATRAS